MASGHAIDFLCNCRNLPYPSFSEAWLRRNSPGRHADCLLGISRILRTRPASESSPSINWKLGLVSRAAPRSKLLGEHSKARASSSSTRMEEGQACACESVSHQGVEVRTISWPRSPASIVSWVSYCCSASMMSAREPADALKLRRRGLH